MSGNIGVLSEQASIEAVLTNYGQMVDQLKNQNRQFRHELGLKAGISLDKSDAEADPSKGVLPNIPATYQRGTVTFSPVPETWDTETCIFGIQTTPDGRVWICVNGQPLVRFSPHADGEMSRSN